LKATAPTQNQWR